MLGKMRERIVSGYLSTYTINTFIVNEYSSFKPLKCTSTINLFQGTIAALPEHQRSRPKDRQIQLCM